MNLHDFIYKFLIYPLTFLLLLKRMVRGEEWYKEYKEQINLKALEISFLKGELMRMYANYKNGWHPANPIQFNSILKKIKEQM